MLDTGKVKSDESTNIPYTGVPLASNSTYCWKVRTWNDRDQASAFSEPQEFRTGHLTEEYTTAGYPLELHEIEPVRVVKKGDAHYFIEFEKAAFGTLKLTFEDGKPGKDVEIHLGEHRTGTDRVWRPEAGGIVGGGSWVTYFTTTIDFHGGAETITLQLPERHCPTKEELPPGIDGILPFRYCEIVGSPNPIGQENVRQAAIFYRFNDNASHFTSSDKVLNDVWRLCKYTMKATTACGVYVDGHRERIPYEADAYINQLGHYCVDREFTLARHSHEYLMTRPTWSTEWIMHSVLMAWADYMYTGDAASLHHYYHELEAKTLQALGREDGLISTQTGLVTEAVLQSIHNPGKLNDIVDWPRGERDDYDFAPVNTVVNAFHYQSLALMSKIAGTLGKSDDASRYREKAVCVRTAIQAKLFDEERGLFVDGEGSKHSSLHANMFPLAFELTPEGHRKSVLDFIKTKGMACSVYGAQYLLEALYQAGESEYALELMTATSERSWGHMIYDVGTTITLEAWDNRYKPNQDWNHAWGAAPANIIPLWLMGARPLEPGFRKILIQPQPGLLAQAELILPTIRGPIQMRFDNEPGKKFCLRVNIPANMTARIYLPRLASDDTMVCVDGQNMRGVLEGDVVYIDPVGSGEHILERGTAQ